MSDLVYNGGGAEKAVVRVTLSNTGPQPHVLSQYAVVLSHVILWIVVDAGPDRFDKAGYGDTITIERKIPRRYVSTSTSRCCRRSCSAMLRVCVHLSGAATFSVKSNGTKMTSTKAEVESILEYLNICVRRYTARTV